MLGLVPRDLWEHGLQDLSRSYIAAMCSRSSSETLELKELGNCIPVRSGRAALVAALRSLNLPPGARVGVPLYCCSVVFDAIAAAGGSPRFLDVDPATFCISAADLFSKASTLDAVLAVHMFGNPCDMPALQAAAGGLPIVEDCAQAIGSKLNGRMAGSLGTIAIFSFRSGKYLSVGEGGAIFSKDSAIHARASQLVEAMPAAGAMAECSHVSKTYLKSVLRTRPFYGVVGYPLWRAWNRKQSLTTNFSIALGRIYKADLTITRRRLARLDSAIAKQRANAEYFFRTLKLENNMLCLEQSGAFYNRLQYPITFASIEQRDSVAAYLLSKNIDTVKYLDGIVNTAARHGYMGDCPVAELLSERVLIIPSYHSLNKKEVQRIAHCLNEGWKMVTIGSQQPAATCKLDEVMK